MSDRTALDILKERGFVEQMTNEAGIAAALAEGQVTYYAGYDPTGPALHIGNLVPIMAQAHLQREGHRPIVVVGGATAQIGDPSGKDAERQLLTVETIEENAAKNREQIARFVDFEGDRAATMVNNFDWTRQFSYIDWLREVGKYFSVNYMMSKESVRRRLEDREQGISYTEFSYMLLQAYDFLHLHKTYGCLLQVGGRDQWGNITAGIELIRRKCGVEAFGITFPLITTASGEKFGKSAGNAVWLDAEATSPYAFYQYWIQTNDNDVDKYLKLFTFLPIQEIEGVVAEHGEAPHRRLGQKRLAEEATRLAHGEAALENAIRASQVLFGREISGLSDRDLSEIFAKVPSSQRDLGQLETGIGFLTLLAESGVCKSKGEARRLVSGGGAYINNTRITDIDRTVGATDLASESMLVLRTGKKNYHLVQFN